MKYTPGVVVYILRRYFLSDQRRCNQPRPNYYPLKLAHLLFIQTAHVVELNPLSIRQVIVVIKPDNFYAMNLFQFEIMSSNEIEVSKIIYN